MIVLKQTLDHPIHGFWDGGPKRTFEWSVDHLRRAAPGFAVVGSWEANHWFTVKAAPTEKGILANARRALTAKAKKVEINYGIKTSFEYLER